LSLVALLILGGCKFQTANLFNNSSKGEEQKLVKAEITFTNGQTIVTYLSSLGIDPKAQVYVGGSSANYMYDEHGNVTGVFNYQQIIYIKVLKTDKGLKTNQ
jgi:hypothetical protein